MLSLGRASPLRRRHLHLCINALCMNTHRPLDLCTFICSWMRYITGAMHCMSFFFMLDGKSIRKCASARSYLAPLLKTLPITLRDILLSAWLSAASEGLSACATQKTLHAIKYSSLTAEPAVMCHSSAGTIQPQFLRPEALGTSTTGKIRRNRLHRVREYALQSVCATCRQTCVRDHDAQEGSRYNFEPTCCGSQAFKDHGFD